MEALVEVERRAQALEGEKVRVDSTAANDVPARGWKLDVSASREQRTSEQNGSTNSSTELGVEIRGPYRLGVDVQRVLARPAHVDARRRDQLDERFDVTDARDVFERDRMFGEQRRTDDGQRGVFVSGWTDGAGELMPSLDDELQCVHCAFGARDVDRPSEE